MLNYKDLNDDIRWGQRETQGIIWEIQETLLSISPPPPPPRPPSFPQVNNLLNLAKTQFSRVLTTKKIIFFFFLKVFASLLNLKIKIYIKKKKYCDKKKIYNKWEKVFFFFSPQYVTSIRLRSCRSFLCFVYQYSETFFQVFLFSTKYIFFNKKKKKRKEKAEEEGEGGRGEDGGEGERRRYKS